MLIPKFRMNVFNVWKIYRTPKHTFFTSCNLKADNSEAEPPSNKEESNQKIGGFAKAFQKYTAQPLEPEPIPETYTFASLLRNSSFIDLGDPEGKVVIGEIFNTVEDDLYIDFGWKFYCVCPRPYKRRDEFVRGAKVRLAIRDLELSTRFLGAEADLTLLEADCRLLGIVSSPVRPSRQL